MYALRQTFTTMLLALACTANAETITVLDDTHTRHKIRLTGIDAPEKRQGLKAGPGRAGSRAVGGLDCNLVQAER